MTISDRSQDSFAPSFSVRRALVAMLVVGIWISVLCSAPQFLANILWRHLGYSTDLPLRHLLQVILNSIAVVAFLFATKRAGCLRPARPAQPLVILLFIPLMAVNLARGPLVEFTVAFYLTTFVSTFLTGFWEEFLFRRLIQDRLAVLGYRVSLVVTSALFAVIHWYGGWFTMFVAFTIGLSFSVARDRLGLWPLVLIHGTIDLIHGLFRREWESFGDLSHVVISAYCVLALVALLRPTRKHRS